MSNRSHHVSYPLKEHTAGVIVVTWRFLINELLQDGRIKQSETANEETCVNAFDRRVVDTRRPQGRVDDVIEQRDHDDDGNGVDVAMWRKWSAESR